jgi:hypothetical protein
MTRNQSAATGALIAVVAALRGSAPASAPEAGFGVGSLSIDHTLVASLGTFLPAQMDPMVPPPPGANPAALNLQIAQDAEDGTIARMIISPIVGYGFGIVLGVIGGIVMIGVSCDLDGIDEDCLIGVLVGIYAGVLLGTPLGVTWASSWFDGQGSYVWALLGTLLGVAVAFPISYLVGPESSAASYGLSALPAIGSMVGYELQSAKNVRDMRRAAGMTAGPPTFAPILESGRPVGAAIRYGIAF